MMGLTKAEKKAALEAGEEVGQFIEIVIKKTDLSTYTKDEWEALCVAFAGAFMQRCYSDMDAM